MAMKKFYCKSGASVGLALLPVAAVAEQMEQLQTAFSTAVLYAILLFIIIVGLYAYFMRFRDKRRAPVVRLFAEREPIHSVGPNTSVAECVRTMTDKRIGALIVLEGEKLIGIFTERDALNRVLAAALDPVSTKISAVMTKDPFSIPPGTTVAEAMELVTKRRFRHLPIVENGKVLAVISSGDLTHWLVKDQVGEVQELVDLAARS
jgi:CBS domain-containing protein